MKFPTLAEMQTSREWTNVFGGYNHNLQIGNGEFYEMTNMTGDDAPVLSPRGKRGIYIADTREPSGLISKDTLCYVDGAYFYFNGDRYNLGLVDKYDEDNKLKPKKLISMGAYVIILPDKKYFNTATTEHGDIEAHYITTMQSEGKMALFYPSMLNGDGMIIAKQPTAPSVEDLTNIPYWLDTSEKPNVLKVYSTSTKEWSVVATTYVKIEAYGINEKFNVGDAVSISGVTVESLKALNASTIIQAKGDNYIVVTGLCANAYDQDTPIVVSRWMPDLDHVCESQNRLWGCHYGYAYQGKVYDPNANEGRGDMVDSYGAPVNEIYSSKLGDFKNWQCYQGIASDSYVVTVGTDGVFTGAVTHLGYPIFFKENYMHKIYGSYPSNYQVQTTACRGVQKGCDRSLALVNEVLYYKSQSGIMAYDGSLPTEVSSALGDKSYSDARGGSIGNKYYVSMQESPGAYSMFAYDTKRGIWHREDTTEALLFCASRGDLYYIDYADKQIKTVKGTGTHKEADFDWSVVTGLIGTDSPDKKYISKIDIRMKLVPGAEVSLYAEYDSSGEYEFLFNMVGKSLKSFAVPIKPLRCDHMRLKLMGRGEAKIFSICKTVEWGSDE